MDDIALTMEIRYNRLDFLDNLDASSLLDNIFDNALYACAEVESDRRISVKLNRINDFVVLVVTNTKKNPVISKDGHFLSTRRRYKERGLGIENIIATAEKYGGDAAMTHTDDEFDVGHLMELAQPQDYDDKYQKWRYEDLPIAPARWKYLAAHNTKQQLKILVDLMKRSDVGQVINACDAGREGELSVPALVEPEHIMKANSIVDMIDSSASMAGPVIGGLLFSVFGLTPILYVSIGCFFASVALDVFIHIPFEKRATSGNIFEIGINDMKESYRFMLRERPVLWKVSFIFASSNLLLTALILIGLPVIVTQRLGFAPDTANRLYGYAQGVIAAGAILGGLLAGVLSNRLKSKASPILLIGCSLSIIIGGLALQTLTTPLGSYIILIVVCGLMLTLHTLFQIQMVTYLQLLTPHDLIGKVISCFICVVMCTSPLGQLIYGFVFEHIGSSIYLPFYVAGLLMIGISMLTRRVFYGIDRQIEEQTRKRVADSD